MVELVALSPKSHQHLKIKSSAQVDFASKQQIMRIRVNEIPQAATNFPILFTRNGRDGSWVLAILTGLGELQNTFVNNSQWTAIFQPSAMQTHPLYLIQADNNKDGYTIGIDQESSAFTKDSDAGISHALFDEKGAPSLYLSRIKAKLEASIQHDISTQDFIKKVDELDLFKAIDFNLHFASGNNQKLAGLYVLDEAKLKALTAEQLKELNTIGYLVPMHTMLSSLHQINALIRNNNALNPSQQITQLKMEIAKNDNGL